MAHRRNGTSVTGRTTMPAREPVTLVTYREFVPAPELRDHVRAYFSFTPAAVPWTGRRRVVREASIARGESFCSPVFADGHASLVIELGATCRLGEDWTHGTPMHAHVIGAMRMVGGPAGDTRPAMLGAYLQPGAVPALFRESATTLADRVARLDDLFGSSGARLAEDLAALDDVARVDHLEAVLLQHLRRTPPSRTQVNLAGLARWARAEPTAMSARRLTDAAGVSRQHLARLFNEQVGVSPKRYCRLARFQAGLAHAGAGPGVRWAQVATDLGYADQSHMIAEFRELSSLTPGSLATGRWFHPFILQARARSSDSRSARVI
jgi:AraC-like DNA-binding protein